MDHQDIENFKNLNKETLEEYVDIESSIYETTQTPTSNDTRNQSDSNLNKFNFTYSANDKKLSFVGNDADSLPTEIIYEFGLKTLILDITFNDFSDLRDLVQFPNLEELICDNNLISEKTNFPKLEKLRAFSCNKNKIEDIHVFIDKVKVSFASINYLSMMGNLACPNQLIDTSKDEYDYDKYRKYVIYRLKNLKFLDCYEITAQERNKVETQQLFYNAITISASNDNNTNNENEEVKNNSDDLYSPLPTSKESIETDETNEPKGSFGYCKYIYYGKQSEGNRFIKNDDL